MMFSQRIAYFSEAFSAPAPERGRPTPADPAGRDNTHERIMAHQTLLIKPAISPGTVFIRHMELKRLFG